MTKVKICGLTQKNDILYVNEAMPDYIGFVFCDKSRRNIDIKTAGMLKENLNSKIKTVGVFLDKDLEFIKNTLKSGIIDLVQLHGEKDISFIKDIKNLQDIPIIKAVQGKNMQDYDFINDEFADFLLFDSPMAGSGKMFDWGSLPQTNKKFFLAGGLTPENVKNAINTVNPYAVDVSGGVEKDGFKDKNKILEFIRRAKNE